MRVDADQVLKNLHKLQSDMQGSIMGQCMQAAAHIGEGKAKENIRRYKESEDKLIRTGNMLNSVQVAPDGKEAVLYVGAEYGVYHEMGTVHIPARPYLQPAVTEHKQEIVQAALVNLRRLVGV